MSTDGTEVLLIEDDDQLRVLLSKVLSRAGYVVREACNGREGVAYFDQFDPDVVVTDIVMPEQEGLETISILRARGGNTKIVAMTGGGRFSPDNYLSIAKQLGAHAVLPKPFSGKELLKVLSSLLGTSADSGISS